MFAGKRSVLLLVFVVSLLLLRQIAVNFEIYHFQPYAALFFGLTALGKTRWLVIPFVGYLLSSILTTGGVSAWMLGPLVGYGLLVAWGRCFQSKASFFSLLGGAFGGAAIFYAFTCAVSWLTIPEYSKSFTGFIQALTVGLPNYAPAWTFFRNEAVSTVLFTAILLVIVRYPLPKKAEEAITAQA